MSLVRNARTLLTSPKTMRDFALYHTSKLRHGAAIRNLHGVQLSSFNSFSEFHTCDAIDESERRFLETFDFGEGAVFDIGANLGLVSIILAKRFPKRPVYSFEPNPSTFRALKNNLRLNNIINAECFEMAVYDKNGPILFDADPRSRATNKIVERAGDHSKQVRAITIDSFLERHGINSIALLKIDVEGFEEKVLEGAARALGERRINIVYYEVCPDNARRAGLKPMRAGEMLLDAGYHLYKLDEGLRPAATSEVDSVVLDNWVACLNELQGCGIKDWS